jgi:hypothetical protein
MSRREPLEQRAREEAARIKAEEAAEKKRDPELPDEDKRLDRA